MSPASYRAAPPRVGNSSPYTRALPGSEHAHPRGVAPGTVSRCPARARCRLSGGWGRWRRGQCRRGGRVRGCRGGWQGCEGGAGAYRYFDQYLSRCLGMPSMRWSSPSGSRRLGLTLAGGGGVARGGGVGSLRGRGGRAVLFTGGSVGRGEQGAWLWELVCWVKGAPDPLACGARQRIRSGGWRQLSVWKSSQPPVPTAVGVPWPVLVTAG